MAKKFYSIKETKTDWVVRITKSEFYSSDPDGDNIPMTITIDSDGEIRLQGESKDESYTLEEFIDMVDDGDLTFEKPLFFADEKVGKHIVKGKVTSVSIGCETYTKEEVIELVKELGWDK